MMTRLFQRSVVAALLPCAVLAITRQKMVAISIPSSSIVTVGIPGMEGRSFAQMEGRPLNHGKLTYINADGKIETRRIVGEWVPAERILEVSQKRDMWIHFRIDHNGEILANSVRALTPKAHDHQQAILRDLPDNKQVREAIEGLGFDIRGSDALAFDHLLDRVATRIAQRHSAVHSMRERLEKERAFQELPPEEQARLRQAVDLIERFERTRRIEAPKR